LAKGEAVLGIVGHGPSFADFWLPTR
jgi:hypothetical protein